MPSPTRSLPIFLFFTIVLVVVFVTVGVVLLGGALSTWEHGQLMLTRSRVVPRVVTMQVNGVEFVLRCALLVSLALSFLSFALVMVLVAGHRIGARQAEYVWPRFAIRACVVPAACFVLWCGLRIVLPLVFP